MNERTAVLGTIADMQTLLTEAAHDLNSRIDWNVSIGAIASRTAVVDPITSTMIRQFADTLAAVANLAIDQTDHDAAHIDEGAGHDLHRPRHRQKPGSGEEQRKPAGTQDRRGAPALQHAEDDGDDRHLPDAVDEHDRKRE